MATTNSTRNNSQPMRFTTVICLLVLASLSGSCTPFSVAGPTNAVKSVTFKPIPSHRHGKASAHVACIGAGCNTRRLSLSSHPTDGALRDPEDSDGNASKTQRTGLRKRLASYFNSSESDDGLTFRQRLAKMGLATVLSYGWISNTNAMILVAAAWYVFCAKVGSSREVIQTLSNITCYRSIVASSVSSYCFDYF
jgi:hypothetical protein